MLPTKFRLIWPNGFREDLFLLSNHKQQLPMVAMEILYRLSGFRVEHFLEIDQPKQEFYVCKWIGTK